MKRWYGFVLCVAIAAMMFAGCATVKGVGQDIQTTGSAISDAAS